MTFSGTRPSNERLKLVSPVANPSFDTESLSKVLLGSETDSRDDVLKGSGVNLFFETMVRQRGFSPPRAQVLAPV